MVEFAVDDCCFDDESFVAEVADEIGDEVAAATGSAIAIADAEDAR